jgi:hypothetical protein
MDAVEIRNRTVSTVLAAFGAAATTATFLYMFQDSSDAAALEKEKLRAKSFVRASAKDTNGPIAVGIPKVGDASALFPDFVGGLNGFAKAARSASPSGLGECSCNTFG